jgi:hypothetical protein
MVVSKNRFNFFTLPNNRALKTAQVSQWRLLLGNDAVSVGANPCGCPDHIVALKEQV